MRLPYRRQPAGPHDPFPGRDYQARPVVLVELSHGKHREEYFTLIDSGADFCVFHASLGELLGLDVRGGKSLEFFGTSGTPQRAFFHTVKLGLGEWHRDCFAGFSYDIERMPHGILGQHGFFDHFEVCFDYINESVELKPKESLDVQ